MKFLGKLFVFLSLIIMPVISSMGATNKAVMVNSNNVIIGMTNFTVLGNFVVKNTNEDNITNISINASSGVIDIQYGSETNADPATGYLRIRDPSNFNRVELTPTWTAFRDPSDNLFIKGTALGEVIIACTNQMSINGQLVVSENVDVLSPDGAGGFITNRLSFIYGIYVGKTQL